MPSVSCSPSTSACTRSERKSPVGFARRASTSGRRYSTIASDAACPASGFIGPVLICSAHAWNCGASSSGTPAMPQITCTGYFDVTLAHEVGAAERRDVVEQRVDHRTHERLVPLLELRRAEGLGDEVAVLAVLGTVHREDQVAHELPDVFGVDRRRERLAVAQHLLRVLVARDLVRRARTHAHPALARDDGTLRTARHFPVRVRLRLEEVDGAVHGCRARGRTVATT